MPEKTRFRLIPATRFQCLLSLLAGVLLLAYAGWQLSTSDVRYPVFLVIAAVAAAAMVGCAVIGLAAPRLRDR
jgi:membrane protein DedA with SNARE-associated domain